MTDPHRRPLAGPPLVATYRLQLGPHLDFAGARALVPYLARLGVSHLYLSPVLQSRAGSTHGYDVVDPSRANPALGGDTGFDRLAEAARRAGLGVVLDVVPNHMATGPENPYWDDVLARGEASPYARWFDVDWTLLGVARRRQIALPVLGETADAALARGALVVRPGPKGPRVHYYEHSFPLSPETAGAFPGRGPVPADAALLARQHWRLAHWRNAWRELNYRRFFDVSDLVALRAEDPTVFEATHAWALARVEAGQVHALRVDHVDGLRDPLGYLRRLRAALDARAPGAHVPVFVEKIVVGGERLRPEWPADGTTGYEALGALERVFVDAGGAAGLERGYRHTLGVRPGAPGFAGRAVAGKEEVLRRSFRPEIRRVMRALLVAAPREVRRASRLAEAVLRLAAALPVYRTYIVPERDGGDVPGPLLAAPADREALDAALAGAMARTPRLADDLGYVAAVLAGDLPPRGMPTFARTRRAAEEAALRFQQTSGPATAKGVEDTALYRWTPLASLCEVGSEPDAPLADAVTRWHASNAERLAATPQALVPVTTHDTKRGADVRARLDALSEIAPEWNALVARWRRRHAPLRRYAEPSGRGRAVDGAMESLLYQTLVGVWPDDGSTAVPNDDLRTRVRDYLRKAAREAKARTSWTDPDEAYESALLAFADSLTAGDAGGAFRDELAPLIRRVAAAGAWTALARTLLQATAPGTPDVYQGDELWNLVLVDPDNRRPVDWRLRATLLEDATRERDPAAWWREALQAAPAGVGAPKLRVLHAALVARRADPALFAAGAYAPVVARGPFAAHVVATLRTHGRALALVVVPRLVLTLRPDGSPPLGEAAWGETCLELPPSVGERRWRDVLTGREHVVADGRLRVATLLADAPVALFRA
ncbi:malto-oligosyltrehalose synthase [Gemmatimonadetes bacterium T265]|nr:malto-oligosyltrehalose synthase [Gemmatimonadetes bacterium T265]